MHLKCEKKVCLYTFLNQFPHKTNFNMPIKYIELFAMLNAPELLTAASSTIEPTNAA
jgi:hypothetical protein